MPAGAATTTLTLQGTVNHTLGGVYPGAGPKESYASPAVGDITGDAEPEIVVANMDGTVEAFRATDRARLWTRDLGNTAIQASPTLADLSGDGKPDVIIGTMDGRVVWLDGPTGAVVRTFRQGAPQHCPAGVDCRPDGFFATPAVADINGDGLLDIVAPSYDHSVYAWSRGGTLLWRRFLEDSLWSSPVIADVDRDGRPEIILGGDIYAGNNLGVPAGGLVWILKANGTTYGNYPRTAPGQTVWSSPAVADLNGDKYPDIIVGSGANWGEPAGRRVEAFTARNKANLPGWPVAVDGQVMASPAVGDIDDDGKLEVTFASDYGYVYAYEANGTRKWRACNRTAGSCPTSTTKGGTVIADVDGDGVQEVISTLERAVRVMDGRNGAVEATYTMSANSFPGGTSPAVAQVDGNAVIVQPSMYVNHAGNWFGTAGDVTKVYVFTTGTGLCEADWPQFHRNARRDGTWKSGADGWIPFHCPATFVARQYRDFLGRGVDAPGSAYWTDRLHKGNTGSSVIRSFMDSSEFGRVVAPVVRGYLATHGTYPPTAATVDDAVALLRQGKTAAQITDTFAHDAAIGLLSDAQFVTNVYLHVYKRSPSPTEQAADEAKLAGGTTRGQLASGYAEGATGAARLTPEVNVAMVYLGMLGRAPDAGGWTYWVPKAKTSGTDALITGFQRSTEYANRVT
ncbi:FG-GAP-like repeat-containing protein [Aquihabitans sp. McL0605]|uniref:FG-GAP-like repeat-containing protein n=1 Tax=Aquihabitans sp. McL0605 TaxID=3415671 RepID=UPI003CF11769